MDRRCVALLAMLVAASVPAWALELQLPSELLDLKSAAPVPMPGQLRVLPAPGPAAAIDLSDKFVDAATRNQGNVGDCHAFAAVGLLEAAWLRAYKKPKRFSEADLFFSRTVMTGEVYKPFTDSGVPVFREGGWPAKDLEFALSHGISSQERYGHVARRYAKLRENQKAIMESLVRNAPNVPRAEVGKAWANFIQSPMVQNDLERVGELEGSSVEAQREETRKGFSGFHVDNHPYRYLGDAAVSMAPGDCAKNGEAQRAQLLSELRAGRPAAVSMTLTGLSEWGVKTAQHAEHAFVITGVSGLGSDAVFQTRNSWDGKNPTVRADRLCRVHAVTSVLVPGESSSAVAPR